MTNDITTAEDVTLLVHTFYDKVREDNLLGPVFENVVQGQWQPHLEKMCSFWNTVLLNQKGYQGSPFNAHKPLALTNDHFEHWIQLFHETVDQLFMGPIAANAKDRVTQMGLIFQYKLGLK